MGVTCLTRNVVVAVVGESSQNCSEPVLIFWSRGLRVVYNVYSVCIIIYTLLKVVNYYDLSVRSMSVMRFKKKFGWGVGGWGELHPSLFWIF